MQKTIVEKRTTLENLGIIFLGIVLMGTIGPGMMWAIIYLINYSFNLSLKFTYLQYLGMFSILAIIKMYIVRR